MKDISLILLWPVEQLYPKQNKTKCLDREICEKKGPPPKQENVAKTYIVDQDNGWGTVHAMYVFEKMYMIKEDGRYIKRYSVD